MKFYAELSAEKDEISRLMASAMRVRDDCMVELCKDRLYRIEQEIHARHYADQLERLEKIALRDV